MKLMILMGILIFGTLGGWIGASMSDGNWFSGWSILFSVIGSFFGIWVGFKVGNSISG